MISIRDVVAKLISVNSAKSYEAGYTGSLPTVSVGDVDRALEIIMPVLREIGVPESVTADSEACDRWGCCWGGLDNVAEILSDLNGQAGYGDLMKVREALEKVTAELC